MGCALLHRFNRYNSGTIQKTIVQRGANFRHVANAGPHSHGPILDDLLHALNQRGFDACRDVDLHTEYSCHSRSVSLVDTRVDLHRLILNRSSLAQYGCEAEARRRGKLL